MPAPLISSPGDVADERNLARHLLKDELPYDPFLRGKVTLDPVSWDDPAAPTPMVATLTPQEAVNRFGCRPSGCDIVIVILWSRVGTHLDLSKFQKPNGEPYLSGTEYEYEDAASAEEPPIILVYRRTDRVLIDADDPQHDAKMAQRRKAQAFFDRFKNPDGSYRGGFTDYATPTDFVSRLAKDLKAILQKRLEAAPSAPPAAVVVESLQESSPVWTGSPYPGLRPFDVTEAAIFFGRGHDETDALIARLRDPNQRFLAVVGASGSGKSSLVSAGLLPRLRQGAIEGSRHWCVLTLTPAAAAGNPFLALAFGLARELPPSTRKPAIKIAEELANEPRITEYAATLFAGWPAGSALVLFVDQMEELFTIVAKSHQSAFLAFWRMRPAIRGCECWPRCGRTFSPKPWPSPPSGHSSRHRREPICSRPPIRWHCPR
jgi:conflict system STAND superfamily ATPase